jgi:DNA-binding IclR family transcriptional regulator
MREIADRTGETVSVYIRSDVHRICIAAEESPQALRHVPHIGTEQPLWVGSPAKVLLAAAPESLLPRVAALSPWGEAHLPTLRQWRADALRDGYSVSHGEREDGQSVAAAPVVDSHGETLAALSIAGPTARFTDEHVQDFLRELFALATQMSSASFENSPALRYRQDRSRRLPVGSQVEVSAQLCPPSG